MKKFIALIFLMLIAVPLYVAGSMGNGNFVMCNGELDGTGVTHCVLGKCYFSNENKTRAFEGEVYTIEDGKVVNTNKAFYGVFYPQDMKWFGKYDGKFIIGNYTAEGTWAAKNFFTTGIDQGKFAILS